VKVDNYALTVKTDTYELTLIPDTSVPTVKTDTSVSTIIRMTILCRLLILLAIFLTVVKTDTQLFGGDDYVSAMTVNVMILESIIGIRF
jgi:hypothetical protein